MRDDRDTERVVDDLQRELARRGIGSLRWCHGVGDHVLIRTVSYFALGRITEILSDTIVLDEASWVADTGRWTDALTTGTLGEVEPIPAECEPYGVARAAIVDSVRWPHALPREVVE